MIAWIEWAAIAWGIAFVIVLAISIFHDWSAPADPVTEFILGDHVRLRRGVEGPRRRTGTVVEVLQGNGVLVRHGGNERGPFGWGFSEVELSWRGRFRRWKQERGGNDG